MLSLKINNAGAFDTQPKAILLDLDHTLYNYNTAHLYALNKVIDMAQQQFGIEKSQFLSLYEQAKVILKQRLKNTASSHSRVLYFQYVLELYGMKTQPLLILQLEQAYWHHFLLKATLFDGVKEFLAELKLLHIPIAIVTDLTTQIQMRKLISLKIDSNIDYVVSSEESGIEKPAAKPFEIAYEKLKLTKEEPVWMIGESYNTDIIGAKEAVKAITIQKIHDDISEARGTYIPDMYLYDFKLLVKFISQQKRKVW